MRKSRRKESFIYIHPSKWRTRKMKSGSRICQEIVARINSLLGCSSCARIVRTLFCSSECVSFFGSIHRKTAYPATISMRIELQDENGVYQPYASLKNFDTFDTSGLTEQQSLRFYPVVGVRPALGVAQKIYSAAVQLEFAQSRLRGHPAAQRDGQLLRTYFFLFASSTRTR